MKRDMKRLVAAARKASPLTSDSTIEVIVTAALKQLVENDARWSECIEGDYLGEPQRGRS